MDLHEATAQEIQLELIRRASFNEFDGPRVAADLQSHRELWVAALMNREDLITLRDLPRLWHVDTLWIIPARGKEAELWSLAAQWSIDEIDWIGGELGCRLLGFWDRERRQDQQQILRLWWD